MWEREKKKKAVSRYGFGDTHRPVTLSSYSQGGASLSTGDSRGPWGGQGWEVGSVSPAHVGSGCSCSDNAGRPPRGASYGFPAVQLETPALTYDMTPGTLQLSGRRGPDDPHLQTLQGSGFTAGV